MAILNGKKGAHNRSSGIALKTPLALLRFVQKMFTRFLAHGGLERAGSLAYTTLLSLVPLAARHGERSEGG